MRRNVQIRQRSSKMSATLSTLVITNRPKFVDWWTWSITKQTHQPDEVIVATNLEGSKRDLEDFEDAVRHYLNQIKTVRILKCPKKTSLGDMRQMVLEKSSGRIINYVDDDDWYHPWLFADFVRGISVRRLGMVCATGRMRLLMREQVLFDHAEIKDLIHLPFCAVEGELARSVRFAPISLNEDIFWLENISSFIQNRRAASEIAFPIMCVVHSLNTWNSVDKIAHESALELSARNLPTKAPWGVPKDEWATTLKKLEVLRERLGFVSENEDAD